MGDSITSICGTPEYLAPEILRKRPYGVAVDWWSLGTLLYEMIAGLPPFYDKNRQTMYRKILDAPLEPPPHMSAEAADICRKLLVREPTARLGYHGVEEIQAHPFWRGLDWDALMARKIAPPWKPAVRDSADTRNIASEFTNEPAAVTPSPMHSKLRDLTGATPPSFVDFSFTHTSVIDGETYRVVAESDEEDDDDSEGMVREGAAGAAAGGAGAAVRGSDDSGAGTPGGGGGGGGDSARASGEDGDAGVMGSMEGVRPPGGGAGARA